MANFQVFKTIYNINFCITTNKKTTANFLIFDTETTSFFASHCTSPKSGMKLIVPSSFRMMRLYTILEDMLLHGFLEIHNKQQITIHPFKGS